MSPRNNIKPVILIGGVSGVGKTTVGNLVAQKMNLDHHLGAGWIRECLRAVLNNKEYPELFNYKKNSKLFYTNKNNLFYKLKLHKKTNLKITKVPGVFEIPIIISKNILRIMIFTICIKNY